MLLIPTLLYNLYPSFMRVSTDAIFFSEEKPYT